MIIFTQRTCTLAVKTYFPKSFIVTTHLMNHYYLKSKYLLHIHRPEIAQRKLFGQRVRPFAFPFAHLHLFVLGGKGIVLNHFIIAHVKNFLRLLWCFSLVILNCFVFVFKFGLFIFCAIYENTILKNVARPLIR